MPHSSCSFREFVKRRDVSMHGAETFHGQRLFKSWSRDVHEHLTFQGHTFHVQRIFKSWSRDFQSMNFSHFKGTHFVCRDFSSHGAETFRCFQLHGAEKRFESCAEIFQELSSGAFNLMEQTFSSHVTGEHGSQSLFGRLGFVLVVAVGIRVSGRRGRRRQ